jgi:Arc/MetJ family transcription regulator
MRTNIDLNDQLITKGLQISGLKTKKDLVHLALSEFVRRNDQKNILSLRGKVDWSGNLNSSRKNRIP